MVSVWGSSVGWGGLVGRTIGNAEVSGVGVGASIPSADGAKVAVGVGVECSPSPG